MEYTVWKQQFSLFNNQSGLLRCQGRLANADITYETRSYPILVNAIHHLTTLIEECHEHNGVKEALTQLRSRYWIVKGRSLL